MGTWPSNNCLQLAANRRIAFCSSQPRVSSTRQACRSHQSPPCYSMSEAVTLFQPHLVKQTAAWKSAVLSNSFTDSNIRLHSPMSLRGGATLTGSTSPVGGLLSRLRARMIRYGRPPQCRSSPPLRCGECVVWFAVCSILILFLCKIIRHKNRACQERDPRDSCIIDNLKSESWLGSVLCHKDRVCLGGFGAPETEIISI